MLLNIISPFPIRKKKKKKKKKKAQEKKIKARNTKGKRGGGLRVAGPLRFFLLWLLLWLPVDLK